MNSKGLISIVIPVYNIEDYLPKCLDTIARQTYTNLEIILVDDCSTDSSGHICDTFAAQETRAVVFHHKERLRQGAARNTGQAAAYGEFIMFVDGDDYLHLNAIDNLHAAIISNGGYEMAIIDFKETYRANEDIETEREGDCVSLTQKELVKENHWYNLWNKLFKYNVIKDIWAHDYARGQDVDYCFRALLNVNKAIWIKKPLYYYNSSLTFSQA